MEYEIDDENNCLYFLPTIDDENSNGEINGIELKSIDAIDILVALDVTYPDILKILINNILLLKLKEKTDSINKLKTILKHNNIKKYIIK